MRVLCINSGAPNEWTYPVIEGEYYTITGSVIGYEETHVHIAEHPVSKRGYLAAYNKRLFAPLSDLDETTLVNEEFNEKYCVPVKSQPCV